MNARTRTPLIIAAVLVVVTVAAVVAIVATRGGDDDADPGSTTTTTSVPAGDEVVYGTVTVEGEPLPEFPRGGDDPALGLTAPTLIGTTYDGAPMEIVPGEGGPMMVVFLAHWCPHCNDEIPVILDWAESGAIPDDLQVVGVSTAVSEERPNFPPAQWLVDKGWDWPTMADDANATALAAYGGTGFPFFVVVGADGTVKARNSGELPVEQLDALVDAALA